MTERKKALEELLRLLGYGLFAAGILAGIFALVGHKFEVDEDWWDH